MARRLIANELSRAEFAKLQQTMTDKEIAVKYKTDQKAICRLRKVYELPHPRKHINLRELAGWI